MIDVFSRGSFDPAGELIHQFSTFATAGVLTDIVGSVGCAEAKKLTLLAFSNQRIPNSSVGQQCSVCAKTSSLFVPMRVCRVCHRTVCSKCCSKKSLFAGLNYALCQVSCCTNCIVQAKGMKVRPAEESFTASCAHPALPVSAAVTTRLPPCPTLRTKAFQSRTRYAAVC